MSPYILTDKSEQPTYAFGCACLVFIGWLIHRKFVSPWLAAIASKFLSLQIRDEIPTKADIVVPSRIHRPALLHPPPSPPLPTSKIPHYQRRSRLLRLRLPSPLARANPRSTRHHDRGSRHRNDECERAAHGDCGAAGVSVAVWAGV